ncbi:MAG: hypothetical protein HFJ50_08420 [Clostridia bacterium]|jgi:hypothetical protein|nr:hypothetical protein [Clostridia bacterium]
MTDFIPMVKAWKDPKLGEVLKKNFIRYNPSRNIVMIDSFQECEKKAFYPKEDVDGWYPWVREDENGNVLGVYLVASNTLTGVTFTRNEYGWNKVKENSWTLANGFENVKIGAHGVPLDMELYEAMPEHLKSIAMDSWILKDKGEEVKRNCDLYFLRRGHVESISSYYSYDGVCIAAREFLPIVKLPKYVLVRIGATVQSGKKPTSPFRIKLPD